MAKGKKEKGGGGGGGYTEGRVISVREMIESKTMVEMGLIEMGRA